MRYDIVSIPDSFTTAVFVYHPALQTWQLLKAFPLRAGKGRNHSELSARALVNQMNESQKV